MAAVEFVERSAPMIVCDNLVKIYRVAGHDVFALQGLDLIVRTGELMGVVGVSGSGKSTLLNILGGLDRPSAGRVRVNGQNLLTISRPALDRYRLHTVGFVWQQSARNLVSYMSALRNIELPMTLMGISPKEKRRRAEELLELVGLSDRRRHRLSELSGGEQQRVAISVALANRPRLLLADEPTGEVDEANAARIYQIFRDLNAAFQLTTLIVSHDMNLARHVDRVVSIRDGKVSSETVRQSNGSTAGEAGAEHAAFTELIVLDSAGRLQIPKEYRERLGIQRYVRMELLDDGIFIRKGDAGPEPHPGGMVVSDEPADAPRGRLRDRLVRWLRRQGGDGGR